MLNDVPAADFSGETAEGAAARPRSVFSGAAMSRSIMKLATSRGLVIAIGLMASPILGRLFPPEAFGVLGVLTTVLSVISSFATLGYVFALPLAETPSELRNLFVICAGLGVTVAIGVAAGSWLGAEWLGRIFHEPAVARYAHFLPLLFLVGAIRQVFDTTLSCQKRFGAVAVRNGLEISVARLSQMALNVAGMGGSPHALILGTLAGSAVSAFHSGITSIRNVFQTARERMTWAGLRAAAVKHRKFPMVQLWSITLNAVTFGLPVLVLGMRYPVKVVGLYGMAYAMATMPVQLFVGSSSQVFYVEAGEQAARGQSLAPASRHLIRVVTLLTSLPLTAVLLLGPLLFEVFLGAPWREAGVFAQILVPWMALMSVSGPLSSAYAVLNRQEEGLFWNVLLLAGRFLALYAGGLVFGPRVTLIWFSGISVLIVAGLMWRELSLLGVSPRWAAGVLARAYVLPAVFLAPSGLIYWGGGPKPAALGLLAAGCALHVAVTVCRNPEIGQLLLARLPVRWMGRGRHAGPGGGHAD